jgi:hypothetical protein
LLLEFATTPGAGARWIWISTDPNISGARVETITALDLRPAAASEKKEYPRMPHH